MNIYKFKIPSPQPSTLVSPFSSSKTKVLGLSNTPSHSLDVAIIELHVRTAICDMTAENTVSYYRIRWEITDLQEQGLVYPGMFICYDVVTTYNL